MSLILGSTLNIAMKDLQGGILLKIEDSEPKCEGGLCPEIILLTFLSPLQHSSIQSKDGE